MHACMLSRRNFKLEENVCVLVLYICPDLAITKIKLTTTSEATAMARIANMQTWPDIATAHRRTAKQVHEKIRASVLCSPWLPKKQYYHKGVLVAILLFAK